MSDLSALIVQAGVGLPAIFWTTDKEFVSGKDYANGYTPRPFDVDLTDSQTAFGLALKLDEWEARGPARKFWAGALVDTMGIAWIEVRHKRLTELVAEMADRIEYIGLDHLIRRKMGIPWTVEPGTLATLIVGGTWLDTSSWHFGYGEVTCLFGLPVGLSPLEALRAIREVVCSDGKKEL